jgi:protein-disulfide isomerase
MLTNARTRISVATLALAIIFATLPGALAQTQSKVSSKPQAKAAPKSNASVSAVPQKKVSAAQITAAKTLGTKNAPIQFEIFSDFQCPACKGFFLSASHRLIEDYCSAGKVYLVHHDFPMTTIPSHIHSEEAARWANAAAAIGKFHEVESALYTHQESWEVTGKIDEVLGDVLSPADLKRVRALVDDAEVKAALQHDRELGNANNVDTRGTPSIFVTHNGHRELLPPSGVSYNLLKPYLDYLLQH